MFCSLFSYMHFSTDLNIAMQIIEPLPDRVNSRPFEAIKEPFKEF